MYDFIVDVLNVDPADLVALLGGEAANAYKWIVVAYAVIPLHFTCKMFCEIVRGIFGGVRHD